MAGEVEGNCVEPMTISPRELDEVENVKMTDVGKGMTVKGNGVGKVQ